MLIACATALSNSPRSCVGTSGSSRSESSLISSTVAIVASVPRPNALVAMRRSARLDREEGVALRIAEPEHRRHAVAEAADLGVDVHAALPQPGVVAVDVRRLERDAGLAAAGRRPGPRGRERDVRL